MRTLKKQHFICSSTAALLELAGAKLAYNGITTSLSSE